MSTAVASEFPLRLDDFGAGRTGVSAERGQGFSSIGESAFMATGSTDSLRSGHYGKDGPLHLGDTKETTSC